MKSKRQSKKPKSKSKKKKKKNTFLGMKTDRLINISLVSLGLTFMIISFFAVGTMANAPWAGGWEISESLSEITISSFDSPKSATIDASGLKSTQYDIDGQFVSGAAPTAETDCPDILTKTWYPYYLKQTPEGWIKTDEPYIVDTYRTPYSDSDGNSFIVEYVQYSVGMDIQIQTVADTYYKPLGVYLSYGWSFEKFAQDITVRAKIWLNPWTPTGVINDNWTISGGWAGIMSGSVRKVDIGVAGNVYDENYAHILSGIMSQYQALNLFTYDDEPIDEVRFRDETALVGVPDKLEAEVYCRLAPGAKYTSDWLGHWTSVAVRNVYVTYYLRFDFVSTLIYQLALGHQEEATPPPENNTAYAPEITPWTDFLNYMEGLIPNFNQTMMILVLIIGGVLLIIVILKFTGRHKGN